MEDSEIAERVLAGEKELFSGLVSRHKEMVYGMALRFSDADEAEDLAQEVFLRAFRSLASFRGGSKFSTWLYRICRNLCIDSLRRKKGRKVELPEDLIVDERISTEEDCLVADEGRRLCDAVSRLKPSLREPVVLHYYRELTLPEAAALMGLPERTVETRLYRARKILRKILERGRA